MTDAPQDRLRKALSSSAPSTSVYDLAVKLRDEGMPEEEVKGLYEMELVRQRNSSDESNWDALTDTLDFIVGWCSSSRSLFPNERK